MSKFIRTERVRRKKGPQSIGKSRGGRTTKIHSIVADEMLPIARRLSPGSAADDPEGQKLMEEVPKDICNGKPLLMDKAYEGNACRAQAKKCGMRPVVPPKSNRKTPWEYDKEQYKGRNVVERNFLNIKEFRRVYTRYDKLDVTYDAFIAIANIIVFMRIKCQRALGCGAARFNSVRNWRNRKCHFERNEKSYRTDVLEFSALATGQDISRG